MTEVLQQEIRTLKNIFESERDPEGRVFAPLADAFRRAGEVQQAVRLLNDGLARHPQFVPGHVVAAQLYVEQGLSEEAAIAARNALELDGDNVHALRSLLQVLEGKGDDEAEEVRARLVMLEPDFSSDGGGLGTATGRPPAETTAVPPAMEAGLDESPVDGEAETVEIDALGEEPPALQATAAGGAVPLDLGLVPGDHAEGLDLSPTDDSEFYAGSGTPDTALDLAPEMELAGEEPVIDLDSLAPISAEDDVEETVDLADLVPDSGMELPTEEPIIDLDLLATVSYEKDDDAISLADLVPDSGMELPTEEPVIDLDQLGPPAADEDDAMSLIDLAPEPDVDVVTLADLAPEPDEDVVTLAALAPEPDEDVVTLADLAPEPDEAVMDLAELAPEPVMDMAGLAPEPVTDLADLSPMEESDDEATVMDLGALAPDEDPVELAYLAPEEDERVADLVDLAPEPEVVDAVMDLSGLAPEPEPLRADESETTMVDLLDRAPADDIVIDMDALKPPTSPAIDDEADPDGATDDGAQESPGTAAGGASATDDEISDDEGPGEPVYTRTLGELYVTQGAIDKAIDVFRHLSDVSPDDADIAHRLEELESGMALGGEDDGATEQDEEVEALARELAEGGQGEHDVDSPFAWTDDGDGAAEATESGPTIGDYFDGLLTWKPGQKP